MGGEGVNRGQGYFPIWLAAMIDAVGIPCNERFLLLKADEVIGADNAHEVDRTGFDIAKFANDFGVSVRLERHRFGVFVLIFFMILSALAFLLNREFWKDVHQCSTRYL